MSVSGKSLNDSFERGVWLVRNSESLAGADAVRLAPSNDDKLKFYALYKQATSGPCNTTRPGIFDPVGRAKWDAWNALGSMSADSAREEYCALLTNLYPGWETFAKSAPGAPGASAAEADECSGSEDDEADTDADAPRDNGVGSPDRTRDSVDSESETFQTPSGDREPVSREATPLPAATAESVQPSQPDASLRASPGTPVAALRGEIERLMHAVTADAQRLERLEAQLVQAATPARAAAAADRSTRDELATVLQHFMETVQTQKTYFEQRIRQLEEEIQRRREESLSSTVLAAVAAGVSAAVATFLVVRRRRRS